MEYVLYNGDTRVWKAGTWNLSISSRIPHHSRSKVRLTAGEQSCSNFWPHLESGSVDHGPFV